MTPKAILDPETWAKRTFGVCNLKDLRRTGRAVKAAARMASNASASLPAQMQTWKETIALYRMLDEEDVTFEALMQPHFQQTREHVEHQSVALLVQDTTDLDFSHRQKMDGLGQIGNQQGRGLFLQTVLAVVPQTKEVLGCAMQEPFVRTPTPQGETRSQRHQRRERETDVWMRMVSRLGQFPVETTVVHVGDPRADLFPFFLACFSTQTHFLVRVFENRRVQPDEQPQQYLLETMRAWPAQASRPFQVPGTHGRTARQTQVQLAFGPLCVMPPRQEKRCGTEPLTLWAIRVWQEETPVGEEPLEWLLLTSVLTITVEQAWEHGGWYACRWTVEDYHQCLKTGSQIEERQVRRVERLIRLLGLLSPLAVRLLQLRDLSRLDPERPAQEVVEHEVLAVVAARTEHVPEDMTTATFWKAVAQLGGYLGRRGDGPPGWKTLCRGWLHVQTLLEGAHLAFHLLL